MKQLLLILFAIIFPAFIFAQVVAIQNDYENNYYVGIPNPVTIAVEGVKANSIELTASHGRIVSDNSLGTGHYCILEDKPGLDTVFVKKLLKNGRKKLIQQLYFRARCMPKPHANLAGLTTGKIAQNILAVQLGLTSAMNFHSYCMRCQIISYTIAIYRKRKEIYLKTFSDPNNTRIDSVTHDFFYKVKNNDRVIVKDIAIKVPGCLYTDTDPIELTVTDAHKYRRLNKRDTIFIADPTTGMQVPVVREYKRVR